MSHIVTYTICGFEFMFMDLAVGEGVIITPKNYQNCAKPEFIEALQEATKIAPGIGSWHLVVERWGTRPLEDERWWYHADDQELEWMIQEVQAALDQHFLECPEYFETLLYLGWAKLKERQEKRQAKAKRTARREEGRKGFVYLLLGPNGTYKIGRTKDPDNRIATFGVKLPFEVEYEHVVECDDMVRIEKELHEKFADKRVNGEWFDLTDKDIAEIKSYVVGACND